MDRLWPRANARPAMGWRTSRGGGNSTCSNLLTTGPSFRGLVILLYK